MSFLFDCARRSKCVKTFGVVHLKNFLRAMCICLIPGFNVKLHSTDAVLEIRSATFNKLKSKADQPSVFNYDI